MLRLGLARADHDRRFDKVAVDMEREAAASMAALNERRFVSSGRIERSAEVSRIISAAACCRRSLECPPPSYYRGPTGTHSLLVFNDE